jgi:hypothetical protein
MVHGHLVVEQAHEIQALAKELKDRSKENPSVLPNKFVFRAIISKLPHSLERFCYDSKTQETGVHI